MANRLVSVDDNLRLPPAVRSQLRADFEADVADSVARAESAATAAQAAAELATAPTDGQVAALIGDPGSQARLAWDLRYATLSALGLRAPMPLTGTYATRPAADTVLAGTTYTATDVFETFRSDGTVWTLVGAARSDLGYAEITAEHVATTVAGADVPGLSVEFKAGTRQVYAEFSGNMRVGSSTPSARARIILGGSTLIGVGGTTASLNSAVHRVVRIPGLSAGSTYTVKIAVDLPSGTQGASSAAVNAATTNPASLRIFAA